MVSFAPQPQLSTTDSGSTFYTADITGATTLTVPSFNDITFDWTGSSITFDSSSTTNIRIEGGLWRDLGTGTSTGLTWDTSATGIGAPLTYDTWTASGSNSLFHYAKPDPKVVRRQQIRANMAPLMVTSRANNKRRADFTKVTQPEMRALQLLKGMLPADEWRRYLKYGFLTVRGSTGLEYQINRNEHHIYVSKNGTKVAELCIYVPGHVPPTDEVVTKKVMLECDELSVWHRANIYKKSALIQGMAEQPQMAELLALAA